METPESIRTSLIPGEWVSSIDHKSGKIRTETYSGVFVRELRIPPRFSPCKTHSREMPEPNSVSCYGQLNSGSLHQQTRRNSLSRDVCSPVKIMTWCHHYHTTLKARYIPGCLNVMADLLSRSNQVQSTEWSLHPQVFKQICQKWFTPHVDLFATHLNHKLPLYVSPVPEPRAWDIDALNINWTNLTAYAYPPMALLHKVIQKIKQCHCLIIVIAPGWPGCPGFGT